MPLQEVGDGAGEDVRIENGAHVSATGQNGELRVRKRAIESHSLFDRNVFIPVTHQHQRRLLNPRPISSRVKPAYVSHIRADCLMTDCQWSSPPGWNCRSIGRSVWSRAVATAGRSTSPSSPMWKKSRISARAFSLPNSRLVPPAMRARARPG